MPISAKILHEKSVQDTSTLAWNRKEIEYELVLRGGNHTEDGYVRMLGKDGDFLEISKYIIMERNDDELDSLSLGMPAIAFRMQTGKVDEGAGLDHEYVSMMVYALISEKFKHIGGESNVYDGNDLKWISWVCVYSSIAERDEVLEMLNKLNHFSQDKNVQIDEMVKWVSSNTDWHDKNQKYKKHVPSYLPSAEDEIQALLVKIRQNFSRSKPLFPWIVPATLDVVERTPQQTTNQQQGMGGRP